MADSYPLHRSSVHQSIGGGAVADLLLWRRWSGSLILLCTSSALWILFEWAGYNLLSFVANVLFLLVVILFLWAKSASLLNRPLPPIPDLEISEETTVKVAEAIQVYMNKVLSIAQGIAIQRNLKLFMKVSLSLVVASYIGNLCSFLTLLYIGTLLSLSVPVTYEKYQPQVDEKLCQLHHAFGGQFKHLDLIIRRKIPFLSNMEKKTQ